MRYVNSEEFTNDFINSIRDDKAANFQRRYRDVDVLLIDDIQFLAGQGADPGGVLPHLQHAAQRQQAGRHHQRRAAQAAQRLRGPDAQPVRDGACITDVQPPDLETRIAILRKKAQPGAPVGARRRARVHRHRGSRRNIRELEGALIRVTAFASLNRQPVDMSLAEIVLRDLIAGRRVEPDHAGDDHGRRPPRTSSSPSTTCTGQSRSRVLVTARQIAMYLCRELTDLSLPKIGQQFGGRDHTTVMHADKKIRQLMAERRAIYNQVTELTNRIKQQSH